MAQNYDEFTTLSDVYGTECEINHQLAVREHGFERLEARQGLISELRAFAMLSLSPQRRA